MLSPKLQGSPVRSFYSSLRCMSLCQVLMLTKMGESHLGESCQNCRDFSLSTLWLIQISHWQSGWMYFILSILLTLTWLSMVQSKAASQSPLSWEGQGWVYDWKWGKKASKFSFPLNHVNTLTTNKGNCLHFVWRGQKSVQWKSKAGQT